VSAELKAGAAVVDVTPSKFPALINIYIGIRKTRPYEWARSEVSPAGHLTGSSLRCERKFSRIFTGGDRQLRDDRQSVSSFVGGQRIFDVWIDRLLINNPLEAEQRFMDGVSNYHFCQHDHQLACRARV
ncbi:MAG: hypothetical protein GY758_07940, partial [Fuerstiella sp.]|nr:hypothetical protein [Fuerstiella sp.]